MSDSAALRPGITFPQGAISADPDDLRTYVTGIAALGYDHLVVPDHILGADPLVHPGWNGVYDIEDGFHEPFVLFGFLSAFSSLEFVAGVIVLPQRQTALVAKQAAQVDLLTRGRLRLGVGIGWNVPEYEGLGADFATRGRRIDEQIEVLRLLWTQPSITFTGADHVLSGVGIAPPPIQRPIPVWIAAERATRAFERVGRLGDGWMAMGPPGEDAARAVKIIRAAAESVGRDPAAIGIEASVNFTDGDLTRVAAEIAGWRELGATHITINSRMRPAVPIPHMLEIAAQAMDVFAAEQ
jgi:probable F420-dependent oxidoreductase